MRSFATLLFAAVCAAAASQSLAAGADGKIERDEFLHTKYGFCHSIIPAGYQCTYGLGTPFCKVGLQMKDRSINYFLLSASFAQIQPPKRGAPSKRTVSHKGITCTAKNAHLKALQNCRVIALVNGIERHCQVAIEDTGQVVWYEGTLSITETR